LTGPGLNALITGASGGIGRAVALELARRGYALGLLYRAGQAAAEASADAARGPGGRAVVLKLGL
jgi:3-oxoacyl-[acyl-carrier protein] reductase